jgi:NADH-quinone oxidoreductase subunit C
VTAAEMAGRLAELTGGTAGETAGGEYARACVDVPREAWLAAATVARHESELLLTFFDWLTGVDDGEGGFQVVVHLWSQRLRHGALLRTSVSGADPSLPSLVGVFPGAAWHERETAEMFGITFTGHPGLTKLLLPDEFEGHPLRKDFVLAARAAKAWPGAKEPGESESGAPSRRRIRPPGVPDPAEWGPSAGPAQPEPAERPARRPRPAKPPLAGGEVPPAGGEVPPAGGQAHADGGEG